MAKFLSLVKLLFLQQYRIKSATPQDKKSVKKRRVGTVALVLLLALAFAPMLASMTLATYFVGKLTNGDQKVLTLLVLGCQGAVLLFGINTLLSNVFVAKDADKLLYLPVKSSTIFLAKLTVAYLNEVITTAVTILLLLLPFGIGAGASAVYYVMLLPALFVIPMLPMLVGCLICIPISALINFIGKNNAVRTLLRILLFVVVMGAYMFFVFSLTSFEQGGQWDGTTEGLVQFFLDKVYAISSQMNYVHPDFMLAQAMLCANSASFAVGFAGAVGENAILLALVFAISLPVYGKMLSTSLEGGSAKKRQNATKQQLQVKQQSVVKSLIAIDLKRIVRDSQMGFQCFGGLVMVPLLVVMLSFGFGTPGEGEQSMLDLIRLEPAFQFGAPLAILAYLNLLGIGTNVLGLYPISRENKALYMLKSLPVAFEKILLAKVILATVVMAISNLITCVVVIVVFGVKWYYGLFMMIAMAMFGFGSMCITTLGDLKNPKLGWTNFQQSLKNAKNSWVAFLIALLCVLGIGIVSAPFIIWYAYAQSQIVGIVMWVFLCGASFAFAIVCRNVMNKKAKLYFSRIDA